LYIFPISHGEPKKTHSQMNNLPKKLPSSATKIERVKKMEQTFCPLSINLMVKKKIKT